MQKRVLGSAYLATLVMEIPTVLPKGSCWLHLEAVTVSQVESIMNTKRKQ
jgi:hypothetical protein